MTNRITPPTGIAVGVLMAATMLSGVQAKTVRHHRATAQSGDSAAIRDELSVVRQQIDQLKQAQSSNQAQTDSQVQQLKARVAESETRARVAEAKVADQIQTIPAQVKAQVAAAQPTDGKLHIKGATLTLGGFVEAAAIYRSHNTESDISTNFNSLPYGNSIVGRTSETRFTARQSRISGLAEGDVSPRIHLKGYGEFDFQAAAQTANSNQTNSYNPRIRQLYTSVDWDRDGYGLHFLAGQAWSLATMNAKGITPRNELTPPQIDAQYVPGFVFTRQPQFRLAVDFDKSYWLAVSLENPQTTCFNSGKFLPGVLLTTNGAAGSGFNSANTLSLNNVPDVIVKGAADESMSGHGLHLEAFGIYRNLYARKGVLAASGANIVAVGGTTNVSGGGVGGGIVFAAVPKRLDLQVSGIWGYGVGRYLAGSMPDATASIDGSIHPVEEWGLLAGATFHASPKLDLYLFGGEEREYQTAFSDPAGKINNGLGNPRYDNTGCEVEGATNCVGNTHYIDQVTAGFWHKPYQGRFGRFQWGIQYSFTQRHAFAGNGQSPVANENMVFTSFRYYPF
ncbi:MAG: hypothetical protein ABI376_01705 [Caulobacteraceae bacterium]